MQLIPDRIVIDEASMLGDRLAPVVERIARDYRKQLILVGDFAQAVPVKEGRGVSTSLFQQAERLNLTECHRQTDRDYLDALNEARLGEVSEKTRQLFLSRVGRPEQEDRVMHFFATNRMSDAHNTTRLSQVKGAPALLTATYNDLRPMHKRMKSPLHPFKVTAAIDASPMAHNLRIKVGARVMMTLNSYADPDVANVDRETNWVNGDLGTIEDVLLDKDELLSQRKIASLGSPANNPVVKLIRVRLDRKPDQVVIVGPHVMPTYEVDKDPTGEVVGFPVTLGYSCTVHKSQGLTLDQAYIDMKSITFMPLESRHGLAYVALSRTRTLGGLYLSDWVDQAVYCDPELKGFIR
jgi:ATP-dependent exoDNAse (exonuclease V) alpha subunit